MIGRLVYQRYFARQIYGVFLFILLAFVSLFFFFDLLNELGSLNKLYTIPVALARVALLTPRHFYEIIPIAALIGTIYVFAQLASSSEYTIFRVAGLNIRQAVGTLLRIGLPLVLVTYLIGEYVGPFAEQMSERVRLRALGTSVSSGFRSGVWVRDSINDDGRQILRFINVGALQPDQTITQVRIYEFDGNYKLRAIRLADEGHYEGPGYWQLKNVSETLFREPPPVNADPNVDLELSPIFESQQTRAPALRMHSELTPQILSVLLVRPESMAILDLFRYIRHLRENRQDSRRYEIALWKKIAYPLTVLVMMILALPFAYLHARSGAVGIKVFGGIMLGMSFVLLNTMFSHVGLLNAWSPVVTAFLPATLYLGLAFVALFWVDRH